MTLHLKASSDKVLRDFDLSGTAYSGPMVSSSAKETLRDFEFLRGKLSNSVLLGQHAKTGFHLFNEVNSYYRNVTVEGIDKEHGGYPHCPRGVHMLKYVKLLDCGAQGWQIVYREPESDTPGGHLKTHPDNQSDACDELTGVDVMQCGLPRGVGRASFALSFFGYQNGPGSAPLERWDRDVSLQDVVIQHISTGYKLKGALLVVGRPELLVLGGRTTYRGLSDRSLWQIRGVSRVHVDGHAFEGHRQIDLDDLPGPNGRTVDEVLFENCSGTVNVRVNGHNLGPVSAGIRWKR